MADAPSFDVMGAMKAGYTPAEIADHLGDEAKYNVKQARASGYTDGEIINHLAGTKLPTDPEGLQALLRPVAESHDPTEGMSGADKFFAGAGKGMTDVVRGGGQLARDALGNRVGDAIGAPTQADVDATKMRDAPLLATGAGVAGDVTGTIAASLPAVLVPGAATLRWAAAVGAGLGLAQPVASDESRVKNTLVGGAAGGAGVIAGRVVGAGVKATQALLAPFTETGRQQIAGRTLQRFGVTDADLAGVSNAPTVTGAKPTLAEQIARPEGAGAAARLQDSLGSVDPQIGAKFQARAGENNAARVQTLNDLAGTGGARDAAVTARESAADQLYGQARAEGGDASAIAAMNARLAKEGSRSMSESAQGLKGQLAQAQADTMSGLGGTRDTTEADAIKANIERMQRAAVDMGKDSVVDGKGFIGKVDVSDLLDRPALREAIAGASNTAANFGQKINEANPVSVLHYAKMGLDGQISEAVRAGNNTKAASLQSAKQALLGKLEEISPTYKQASQTYADMSRPINQMDVAQQVLTKGTANTTDLAGNARIMPNAITGQLKDEGKLIESATGRSGMKLADLLDPDQLTRLKAVTDEADRSAAIGRAANGPGSATAQRLASHNVLSQVLGPTGLPQSWAESTLLHSLLRPVQFAYNGVAEPKVQTTLADLVLNPEKARAAMATLAPPARTKLSALLSSPSLQQAAKSLPPSFAVTDPSTKSFEQKAL